MKIHTKYLLPLISVTLLGGCVVEPYPYPPPPPAPVAVAPAGYPCCYSYYEYPPAYYYGPSVGINIGGGGWGGRRWR